ncbi:MAG: hypothetical protein HY717_22570 [Planctomycetes bacterium]|nr:hypothetical protein [Planctomycetota bacterium]
MSPRRIQTARSDYFYFIRNWDKLAPDSALLVFVVAAARRLQRDTAELAAPTSPMS